MIEYVVLVLVAIFAGIGWSLSGYFVNWRKNHDDDTWEGFNLNKLGSDALLDAVLGIASSIAIIAGIFEMPIIDSVWNFFLAFPSLFTVIVLVDKFIVGGAFRRQQS
jgi:hypothetical protein